MRYIFILLVLSIQLYSQTNKVEKLNKEAIEIYRNNSEKSVTLLEKALSESITEVDSNLTHNNLGIVYRFLGDFKKAKQYSLKSLKTKDLKVLTSTYNNIGACNRSLGLYEEAIKYYIKALKIHEKQQNYKEHAIVCNNIGMVYSSMELFDKAKEYNLKAINKFKEINYLKGISESYNNYAIALANQDSLELAGDFFKKSLEIEKKIEDKKGISESLNNIGGIYYYQGKTNEALDYFFEVIKIEKELKNFGSVSSTYNNISQVLLDAKSYENALKYTDSAYFYSKKYNISEDLLTSLNNYISYYENINDLKSANKFYKAFIKANDSVKNKNNLSKLHDAEVKYQTEKKEKQLAEAKVELLAKEAKIKKRTTFLYSALALAFLLGLIGFLVYKQQRLKNQQIIKENDLKHALIRIENQNNLQEQRLAISKDLHDNIGSQLTFIISSLDNLKYFEFTKDKLYSKFDSIGTFTRSTITDLRDTIWAMNKEAITFEDLKTRTTNFIEAAKTSLLGITFEFNYPEDTNEVTLNSLQGIDVYRIIQEAVNNAVKHANATKIAVDFILVKNTLEVSIIDNGKGFDKESTEAGNGLNSMKKRAQEINADFSIEPLDQGTKVRLKFKL
ncbi:tetratricopeptide repeat-containing sensor histidine kinase [Flavobacterium sp.]|uniref:tetratricopeptide repeat-containing sensor histidine kinase n=1 Tax=Flavobacterium sp. TaxID=239 RepID=UPI004048D448